MTTQTKKSECRKAVREYVKQYSPYELAPRLGYNIAEMSRYAAKNNRKVSELSADEVALFAVDQPASF
ncbi:MAG: hypothetical protein K6E62_11770 [Lachnospiraceae bacterium]|nr:hypothetical protein [Lachnospiraceae bacterium]